MRDKKRHWKKFVCGPPCYRKEKLNHEEVKEIIDDLDDKELQIISDLLSYFWLVDGRFQKGRILDSIQTRVVQFLRGKIIQNVSWLAHQGETPVPRLEFTDGTALEIISMVDIPGSILYGTVEKPQGS